MTGPIGSRPGLAVVLPSSLAERLAAVAAERGVSQSDVLDGLLTDYIERDERVTSGRESVRTTLRPDPSIVAAARALAAANGEQFGAVLRALVEKNLTDPTPGMENPR